MTCRECPPYVDTGIIDHFDNRTVAGAWDTPSRGAPDWLDHLQNDTAPSFSQLSVSSIGSGSNWGRIILTIDAPESSLHGYRAVRQVRLAVPEIADWNEFVLRFHMVVNPVAHRQEVAYAQIRLGGNATDPVFPMIDLPFQFEHHTNISLDHMDFFLARDALGGVEHTVTQQIAMVHSFDGIINIDRSVERGSTLVTVGALGTFEFAPIGPVAGAGPPKNLYVAYVDGSNAVTFQASTLSIDNLAVGNPPTPHRYQMVQDEVVGVGNGLRTAFTTRFAYIATSLQVHVAGMLSEVDATDPATGAFTLVDPPPLWAGVRATYRAQGG